MIYLARSLVTELLDFVSAPINLNLIANVEDRLINLFIADSSQVHFARFHINNLNTLIDWVVNEFVGALSSCHLIVPGELEGHAVILC